MRANTGTHVRQEEYYIEFLQTPQVIMNVNNNLIILMMIRIVYG
jgi:hypothetical protein